MAQSSPRIEVARHDLSCAVLYGGVCNCVPETSTIKYVRVCANCGGELADRRRAYCSRGCKRDSGIRGVNLTERQARDQEYRARSSDP